MDDLTSSRRRFFGKASLLGAGALAGLEVSTRHAVAETQAPGAVLGSIAELRANRSPSPFIFLAGYHGPGAGGGYFRMDPEDHATRDDGGLTIVDRAGQRYKRVTFDQPWNAAWWGAIGDGESHPLRSTFPDLAAAQQIFPHAQDLGDEFDWVGLQAALAAAGSDRLNPRAISIPAGDFLLNRSLQPPPVSNLAIQGEGGGSEGTADRNAITRLLWTGREKGPVIGFAGINPTKGVTLRDLLIDCGGHAIGIAMPFGCQNYKFARITIQWSETAWLVGRSCFSCRWEDCEVNGASAVGIDLTDRDHSCDITGCVFRNRPDGEDTPSSCIRIGTGQAHSSNVTITGCNFDFHRVGSFIDAVRVWGLTVIGCYFEGRDAALQCAVRLGRAEDEKAAVLGATIHGCRITIAPKTPTTAAIVCERVKGLHIAGNYIANWPAALAIDHEVCDEIGWDANECPGHVTTEGGKALSYVAGSAGLFVGKSVSGGNVPGCEILGEGFIRAVRKEGPVAEFDQQGSTGEFIRFLHHDVPGGAILNADGTASYGSFSGFHWAQVGGGMHPDILPGTVVETIDELCSWSEPDAEPTKSHLPRIKISDTAASAAVYGVFMRWDASRADCAVIVALGGWMIRVDAGEVLQRGALLESAGNGCAKRQATAAVTASTIGKITAAVALATYPDGSTLVPCTLHCG